MCASADDEKLNKLVEQKLPLVQADYESYFQIADRFEERINRIRTWEVAILAAILAFVARSGTIELQIALPIIMVSGAFALLEAAYYGQIEFTFQEVLKAESKLQETDPSSFRTNIINWRFGNTVVEAHRSTCERLKRTYRGLKFPPLLLWHGTLTLVILAFIWLYTQ